MLSYTLTISCLALAVLYPQNMHQQLNKMRSEVGAGWLQTSPAVTTCRAYRDCLIPWLSLTGLHPDCLIFGPDYLIVALTVLHPQDMHSRLNKMRSEVGAGWLQNFPAIT